ncbi:unnamed protein product [Jaminaea pallidilutea]
MPKVNQKTSYPSRRSRRSHSFLGDLELGGDQPEMTVTSTVVASSVPTNQVEESTVVAEREDEPAVMAMNATTSQSQSLVDAQQVDVNLSTSNERAESVGETSTQEMDEVIDSDSGLRGSGQTAHASEETGYVMSSQDDESLMTKILSPRFGT